jgi:hypothetical protein
LLLATQKSCKTAAGQVEALLRDSYLTGCPFFQQDSWTELIPSNLVTNDTPIYNSREINSYRMNKINEITKPPEKHKTMLVYSPHGHKDKLALSTTHYIFIPTPSEVGLLWTLAESPL